MSDNRTSANKSASVDRITAPLGTREYQLQFEEQANNAINRMTKLWFFRVGCTLFAIMYFYHVMLRIWSINPIWPSLWDVIIFLECLSIIFSGELFTLNIGSRLRHQRIQKLREKIRSSAN